MFDLFNEWKIKLKAKGSIILPIRLAKIKTLIKLHLTEVIRKWAAT